MDENKTKTPDIIKAEESIEKKRNEKIRNVIVGTVVLTALIIGLSLYLNWITWDFFWFPIFPIILLFVVGFGGFYLYTHLRQRKVIKEQEVTQIPKRTAEKMVDRQIQEIYGYIPARVFFSKKVNIGIDGQKKTPILIRYFEDVFSINCVAITMRLDNPDDISENLHIIGKK